MSYFEFPHTRSYDGDLGYIIKRLDELTAKYGEFMEYNTMKFADPVEWSVARQYEAWTLVFDVIWQEVAPGEEIALRGYNLYMSIKPVPKGINIHNEDYWQLVLPFTIDTELNIESNNVVTNHAITSQLNSLANRIDVVITDLETETTARETQDSQLANSIGDIEDALTTTNTVLAQQQQQLTNLTQAITPGSTTADAELIDIRTAEDGYIYPTAGDSVRGQIGNVYEKISEVATIGPGHNLFNPDTLVNGFVQDDGTVDNTGAFTQYKTSDYIPLSINKAYTLSSWLNGSLTSSRKAVCLYDFEKTAISGSYINVSGVTSININNTDAMYARVSIFFNNTGMFEQSATVSDFEPFEMHAELNDNFPLTPTMAASVNALNPLVGKKWIPCGDSFTDYTNATYSGGTFNGKDKTYPRIIALRNNMTIVQDFFLSGRTLAYPADETFDNSLCNPSATYYYQNIPEDADFVTIYLGINDSHHAPDSSGGDGEDNTGEIPIGTIDDNTTATYYGAWNTVLTWLRTNRPFTKVGVIVSNGCDSIDYRTAQINICKKYGVPYIDMNGDNKTPAMIRPQNTDIPATVKTILVNTQAIDPDGSQTGTVNWHPNYKTHEFESSFIEAFLRSL